MDELEKYLLRLGASKVGYANVEGLASEFIDLPYGISLVLKLPKEAMKFLEDEDYESYWKCFYSNVGKLKEIALKGEEFIKSKGYNAFALTMERNECDMEKAIKHTSLQNDSYKIRTWLDWTFSTVCNS